MRRHAFTAVGFGGHVAFTLPLKPAQRLDVAIHFGDLCWRLNRIKQLAQIV